MAAPSRPIGRGVGEIARHAGRQIGYRPRLPRSRRSYPPRHRGETRPRSHFRLAPGRPARNHAGRGNAAPASFGAKRPGAHREGREGADLQHRARRPFRRGTLVCRSPVHLGAASGSLGQDVSRSMTYPVGTPWRTHSCAMPLRVCHEITCSFVANRSLTVAALKAQRSRDREGAVGTVISERPLSFPASGKQASVEARKMPYVRRVVNPPGRLGRAGRQADWGCPGPGRRLTACPTNSAAFPLAGKPSGVRTRARRIPTHRDARPTPAASGAFRPASPPAAPCARPSIPYYSPSILPTSVPPRHRDEFARPLPSARSPRKRGPASATTPPPG